MLAPDVSDHDGVSASVAKPRVELMAAFDESQRPEQSSMSFLDRIGAPNLADIEFDVSLPSSPPRDVDLD